MPFTGQITEITPYLRTNSRVPSNISTVGQKTFPGPDLYSRFMCQYAAVKAIFNCFSSFEVLIPLRVL